MNIAMFTNDYEPIVGGVSRSISTFAEDLRKMGHRVLIVTLEFPNGEESNDTVFRLPAVTEVAGTQFSIKLPAPAGLKDRLDAFAPEIIHSHHPFMLGDTALRVARRRGLPLVFTHHTLYERYTYLFSPESKALQRMAIAIATEYANLCDLVVAPTGSIAQILQQRGVEVPVEVIPTGVDIEFYKDGKGNNFRRTHEIPEDAFVLGYVGRVVDAKNMDFLTCASVQFLKDCPDAWFLVVGDGESAQAVRDGTQKGGVGERTLLVGSLEGQALVDAYAAMDAFAFASKTETQGIVLIEGLSAGLPIVALDASGTRDILEHDKSGVLLDGKTGAARFARELKRLKDDPARRTRLSKTAREHVCQFDRVRSAEKLLALYDRARELERTPSDGRLDRWHGIQERFAAEWDLLVEKLSVLAVAIDR